MQIFALIVLVTIAATFIGLAIYLAMWPGRVARERQHPYADAVNVGGWVGLLAGGVLWPLVLIWAYATPVVQPGVAQTSGADTSSVDPEGASG